ncbi:hypothetical protein JCM6882_004568 [Rhodosporidiobolus microsporus]
MPRYAPYYDLDDPSHHHGHHRDRPRSYSRFDSSPPPQPSSHHPYARPPRPPRKQFGAYHPVLVAAYPDGCRIVGPDEASEPGGLGEEWGRVEGGRYRPWGGEGMGGMGRAPAPGGRRESSANARPEQTMDTEMRPASTFAASPSAEPTHQRNTNVGNSNTSGITSLLLYPLPPSLSRTDALSLVAPFWPASLESVAIPPSNSHGFSAAAAATSGVRVILDPAEAMALVERGRRGEVKWEGEKVQVRVEKEAQGGAEKELRGEGGTRKGKERAHAYEEGEAGDGSGEKGRDHLHDAGALPNSFSAYRSVTPLSRPDTPVALFSRLFGPPRPPVAAAKKKHEPSSKEQDEQVRLVVGERKIIRRMQKLDLRSPVGQGREGEDDEMVPGY